MDTPRRQHSRRATDVYWLSAPIFWIALSDRSRGTAAINAASNSFDAEGQLQPRPVEMLLTSHGSYLPVQAAPPDQMITWRRSSFDTRCRDRITCDRTSSNARTSEHLKIPAVAGPVVDEAVRTTRRTDGRAVA